MSGGTLTGEEMETAAAENNGGVAGLRPFSLSPSSSRQKQGGRSTCSYFPDDDGNDSGKRTDLWKNDREEIANADEVPEGGEAGWR